MTLAGGCFASSPGLGQREGLTYKASYWNIEKNFLFEEAKAVFLAHAINNDQGENINLNFKLCGGSVPVPEPAALLLLGLGLVGLAGMKRKCKK